MSTGSPSQRAAVSSKRLSDDDRIFRDPALDATTPSDDPLVRFVSKYWRLLLLFVVAYGALWYGQIVYRQAQARRADRASEGYVRARESFDQFLSAQRALITAEGASAAASKSPATDTPQTTADAEKDTQSKLSEQLESAKKSRDEARTALVEQLKIVTDQGGTYERIAGLYGALAQAAAGEGRAAESAVSQFTGWRELKPEAPDRILAELAAYLRAKIRLGLPDGKMGAAGELTELAGEGRYLAAAAALALASAATTDEQKASTRDLLQRVRSAHPEQADLLNQELKRLGWE